MYNMLYLEKYKYIHEEIKYYFQTFYLVLLYVENSKY